MSKHKEYIRETPENVRVEYIEYGPSTRLARMPISAFRQHQYFIMRGRVDMFGTSYWAADLVVEKNQAWYKVLFQQKRDYMQVFDDGTEKMTT